MFVFTPWFINLYLVKMKCWSLSSHLVTYFMTLSSVIDAVLNLWDWTICWHIFNKYLVYFENNDSKCTQCSTVDDNTNSCNFFTDSISTCKWSFLWQRDNDSILVIMHDIQACTSGTIIVIFRPTIGIDVLVLLSGYSFLSLLFYDR